MIDAPAFMPVGPNDIEATQLRDTMAQFDIRTPPRHVGRDGHRSLFPAQGHNSGFLFFMAGVEHMVCYSLRPQASAEPL